MTIQSGGGGEFDGGGASGSWDGPAPVGEPMARETDPTGTHSGGNKGWDWMKYGAMIGGAVAIAAMIAFPPAGIIGLIGAAAGAISTTTAAAAIGGKLGKLEKKEASTAPCGEIKGHSTKTKCEGKWIARVTDKTSHGATEMQTGATKVLDGGLLVCRVGEASTCGGKKVVKGASRTIVGGPSASSGKPSVEDIDDAKLDRWIAGLDKISEWTGYLGLGALGLSAARVGLGAGLSRAASRSVMADASKRAVYRQAYQAAARTTVTRAATPALARAAARKAGQQAVINTMGRTAAWKAGGVGAVMGVGKTGGVVGGVMAGMEVGKVGISSGLQSMGGMSKEKADLWAEGVMTVGPDAVSNAAYARAVGLWPKQGKNYVLDQWRDFPTTMKTAVANRDVDMALFGPGLFRPPPAAVARSGEEVAGARGATDAPQAPRDRTPEPDAPPKDTRPEHEIPTVPPPPRNNNDLPTLPPPPRNNNDLPTIPPPPRRPGVEVETQLSDARPRAGSGAGAPAAAAAAATPSATHACVTCAAAPVNPNAIPAVADANRAWTPAKPVHEYTDSPVHPMIREQITKGWKDLTPSERAGLADRMAALEARRKALKMTPEGVARLQQERTKNSQTMNNGTGEGPLARQNWAEANSYVRDRIKAGDPITMDRIQELHGILGRDLYNNGFTAGVLRGPFEGQHGVDVGTSNRMYFLNDDVPRGLEDTFNWYNRAQGEGLSPPELAGGLSRRLVGIHPFTDGNGRVTQLVGDWVLGQNGYPPIPPTGRLAFADESPHSPAEVVVQRLEQAFDILEGKP